jgi:hypothetical protein
VAATPFLVSKQCRYRDTPMGTPDIFESHDQGVLVWGDIVHFPHIQIERPEVSIAFDQDPSLAAITRSRLLDLVSSEGLLIAGMHLGNLASRESSKCTEATVCFTRAKHEVAHGTDQFQPLKMKTGPLSENWVDVRSGRTTAEVSSTPDGLAKPASG